MEIGMYALPFHHNRTAPTRLMQDATRINVLDDSFLASPTRISMDAPKHVDESSTENQLRLRPFKKRAHQLRVLQYLSNVLTASDLSASSLQYMPNDENRSPTHPKSVVRDNFIKSHLHPRKCIYTTEEGGAET